MLASSVADLQLRALKASVVVMVRVMGLGLSLSLGHKSATLSWYRPGADPKCGINVNRT